MNIQGQIKAALFDHEFGEDVAQRIYRSMRFQREDATPEWSAGGNSHAQNEARACMASVVEIVRACLRSVDDTAPHDADGHPRQAQNEEMKA